MKTHTALLITVIGLIAGNVGADISATSIDSFNTRNEGWLIGGAGEQPAYNSGVSFDGQPGFLSHFSHGSSGSNSKFIMASYHSDWLGDYVAAGIDRITLWINGRSGDDLELRLGFDGPGGWFITPTQTIAMAGEWVKLTYPIDPDSLTHVDNSGGTGVAADTMGNVSTFEFVGGPHEVEYAALADLLRAGKSAHEVWFDDITAMAEATTLAGDANGDGQVDGNDLISVEENFGATGDPGIGGDANADGQVDGNDLISVEENFGSTAAADVNAIPEPATLMLLGAGVMAMRNRR